ncbi:MAG: hypothetical protein J5623_09940 [Clostridiales bacterium]|nr:hypothetical protein [Clostridiales bacterium]
MGLIDAINPDARVEIKVGDLYSVLDAAAVNGRTAKFLLNAVNCEVPYRYIREMITGEKETTEDGDDPVVTTATIEIHASEVASAIKKTILQDVGDKMQQKEDENLPFPDVGDLKDCAPEGVSCEDCGDCPEDQEAFFVTAEDEEQEGGEA